MNQTPLEMLSLELRAYNQTSYVYVKGENLPASRVTKGTVKTVSSNCFR